MTNLSDLYNCYNHFWITNSGKQAESQLKNERTYYVEMAHFKKPWTYLYQIPHVLKVFATERPTHVLSMGSGRTAFVPFLISRALTVNFLHVDTFSRVHGHSKFGTFLLTIKHQIYTQWEDPNNERAIYIGPVFKEQENDYRKPGTKYIFVTVGTRNEPFGRLVEAVEELVKQGTINERVIIQAGHTKWSSNYVETFDFCTTEMIDAFIANAKYVITQESAGIGTQCLKHRTKFIVMPRDYQYRELPTRSDMKEDLHYKLAELGYTKVVRNTKELEKAIESIDQLKIGFKFNNTRAVTTLHKAIQES